MWKHYGGTWADIQAMPQYVLDRAHDLMNLELHKEAEAHNPPEDSTPRPKFAAPAPPRRPEGQ